MNNFNEESKMTKLFVFIISLFVCNIQASDITSQVFGSSSDGIIGAFGDFNSDELTDVFVIKDKGRVLEVLLGSDVEPLLHSVNLKCKFDHLQITSVVPGDFDGDAFMDLLITTKTNKDDVLGIYINWGGSEYLNCTDEKQPIIEMRGEPVALDYNKDMIIDLFGLDVDYNRTFWVFNNERQQLWIFLLSYILLSEAWNLSQLNLHANNYTITDVSLYYIRSFLCIKSSNESVTIPTLVETIWPENLLSMIPPKIFPNDLSHAKRPSDCNGIIQAVGTTVDNSGLLWVIDKGSKYCLPKLLIFDLKKNEEIHRYQFNIRRHALTSIQSDPFTEYDCRGRPITRAFITLDNADYLIVYSLAERRVWKLRLITNENMAVIPKDIALLENGLLFVSDECGHLWRGKLDMFRQTNSYFYYEIKVEFIADLLGTSNALTVDPNGSLYYYLPRDGAVVRWNSRKPLNAENHDVLYLSPTQIVEIIFGAKGSVWIVRESPDNIDDHCRRILLRM